MARVLAKRARLADKFQTDHSDGRFVPNSRKSLLLLLWRLPRACSARSHPFSLCILALPLLGLHGFAEPVVLDESQVAREYTQRSWSVEQGLPDQRVRAL